MPTVKKQTDIFFMQRALELAAQARGQTSPNPMVGAVLVKNGKIIAEAWHQKAGEDHAERIALKKAGKSAQGATLYVSLEPCCHFGKTPPCVDIIKQSGVSRVVAAVRDPFPQVSGKGFDVLKDAGIEVVEGVLEKEARRLNEVFFTV
ncbi:MAG TPA: bifunctional diaminohydroxyphosphoribosylaminopyrimidine deaminase/5-amino-6-(5-phosphoribosylamino)uracil reductase RibD, partial [Candidatus Sumerlaeota bacterium]|nr:bifunctional diaminohydroxyphosphoribosylaminopyrimidine deaminase/5-amino-6-(5-phosphoribosylamino)uracil reductase RibD [Candidatus Sumerlaeota bacterium]